MTAKINKELAKLDQQIAQLQKKRNELYNSSVSEKETKFLKLEWLKGFSVDLSIENFLFTISIERSRIPKEYKSVDIYEHHIVPDVLYLTKFVDSSAEIYSENANAMINFIKNNELRVVYDDKETLKLLSFINEYKGPKDAKQN